MKGKILLVDDEQSFCELLSQGLGRRGFAVQWRLSSNEALSALEFEDYDAVLTDINMPGLSGIALCERIAAGRPDIPVIVFTAFGSMETAVAAIRAGAYDFITKPIDLDAVALTLDRALQHRALREEVRRLKRAVDPAESFGELMGKSPAMRKVHDVLERVAALDMSVLITGESGTGKELAARALHLRSPHRAGPFVAVNCSAIPEALLESELFGHCRGAFTNAMADRPGLFVQASGGTLLLDEIGDMPLSLQPKLLRALQERTVRPVGAGSETPFDVRLVCTTNRDIESAVEEGKFREDLFYRINVVQIEMPPLRSRGGDILLLAHNFVEQFAARSCKPVKGLSQQAAEKLLGYGWPGNVRELRNCIERAVALTRFEQISVEDLLERVRNYSFSHWIVTSQDPSDLPPLDEVERRYILRVLEAAGGSRSIAARILGIDRKTLYRKLLQFGAI